MNKKIFILLIFTLCLNIYQVFANNYETVKITNFRVEPPAGINDKSRQIKGLSSDLDRLYKLYAGNKEYQQFARQSDLKLIEDRVVVTILTKPGITTADIDENNLKTFGSRIQAKVKNAMRVEIPIRELENVSNAIKELGVITSPIKPVEHEVTSQGVALMNADNWQSWGYEGSGVKVAVIDGGFDSLTEAQTSGDIPSSYYSCDFTGSGLQTGTEHGTAVTEAIFDLVPDAEFYLFKIADNFDFEYAKDSCVKYGVDIINHSMGWYNASYYDGTGIICETADSAISKGIVWVNSAGNEAQYHYRSVFDDTLGTHDFSGSGGNINYFVTPGVNPGGSPYSIPVGSQIVVYLNWDAYPTTTEDYDLYLYYYDGSNWNVVDSSTNDQAGSGYPYPTERISHVTAYNAPYGVLVREASTTTDHDFTLFSNRIAPFNYRTASSSITDPGTATDVVTVGAINRTVYNTTGAIEYFSSRGPTTDDSVKPDVAAPDYCLSYAYGGNWSGTSLSSPHTAGVCALIKSRYTGYSNSDIRNYLYTNCTVDLGTSGKDNIYGWGKVVMPDIGITVTSPNGGENWYIDSVNNITWTSSGTSGGIKIEYSTDNGSNWSDVIASMPDTGVYPWVIPDTPSDSCLVRITDTIGIPSDTSNAIFEISQPIPNITVTSPNGGENWYIDSTYNITWTSFATSGGVKIEYSIDSASSWSDVITSMPDTGVYPWTLPNTPSISCVVRVTDTNGNVSDTSDAWFEISPTPYITLTSPNGGEIWHADSSYDITWTTNLTTERVKIEYSTNNGADWSEVIASKPADTLAYAWTIPNTPSDSCLVRISDTTGFPSDTSDALFTILPIPYITVTSPNGGEIWYIDSTYDITWTSEGSSGGVQIEYSIDSGTTWLDVIASMPDTGIYPWTISDTPSDSCLVRITDTASGGPSDTSDALFSILSPYITVTSPNGGENWQTDSIYDITWITNLTTEDVRIEYSTNNGANWSEIITGIPADTLTYSWTVPDNPSDSCLVRIAVTTTGSPSDTSDAIFTISPASGVPASQTPRAYSMIAKTITVGNQLEVNYGLPEKSEVKFEIYDIKGTKIKEVSKEHTPGFYSIKIGMIDKPTGVYFLTMEANKKKFIKSQKVILVR